MNKTTFTIFASLAIILGLILPLLVSQLDKITPPLTPSQSPIIPISPTTTPINQVGENEQTSVEPIPSPLVTIMPPTRTDEGVQALVESALLRRDLLRFRSYHELYEYTRTLTELRASYAIMLESVRITPPTSIVPSISETHVVGTPTPQPGVSRGDLITAPTRNYSRTNVQVEGIDEPDIVKTDGRVLVVSSHDRVYLVDPVSRNISGVIDFDEAIRGVYLYSDKLIVLAEGYYLVGIIPDVDCRCFFIPPRYGRQVIYVFNISRIDQPVLLAKIEATGYLQGSRLKDKYAYFILNTPLEANVIPLINEKPVFLEEIVAVPGIPTTYTVILVLDLESLDYKSYTFLTGEGSWLYMSHRYLYIAREDKPEILGYYVLFIKETLKYMPIETRLEVEAYLRRGDLRQAWLTLNRYLDNIDDTTRSNIVERISSSMRAMIRHDSTIFYVFNIDKTDVSYRGLFIVDGELLDQFAMAEYKDYFIVATTVNRYELIVRRAIPEPLITIMPIEESIVIEIEMRYRREWTETLTTLPERGDSRRIIHVFPILSLHIVPTGEPVNNIYVVDLASLEVIGRLEGLAPGERIYAARLIGDVFYLVTFREVDPLFAIDISDPRSPRVIGFLKTPGFSEYLHPLPGNRMLGVGVDDSISLKISLFNITDPTNIAEISTLKIKPGWSPLLVDHRAITTHYSRRLVFIPFSRLAGGEPDGILAISYDDDYLVLIKLIVHQGASRSVYIGNELFTISYTSIKIIDLDTLNAVDEIQLPYSQNEYFDLYSDLYSDIHESSP